MLLSLTLVTATIAAIIGGIVVRRIAPAIGAVVPPRKDRWHSTPTPTMGGMAIAAGTVVGFAVVLSSPALLDLSAPWVAVALPAVGMFIVGVFDDRLQLSPIAKLVASLALGAFCVFLLSGADPSGAPAWWLTLLATVWFAGICHAINLLDNMDGLAAGVALIATGFMAWLVGPHLGPTLVLLLAALAGGLLGFLYWNRPPARLFMGDCGSLFIGAVLAGSSLVPVFRSSALSFVSPTVLVVLILVVPLFDTSFVLVLRRAAGRKASKGGTDHVSHRLASLGFSERSAVRILYLLGIVGGGTAALLRYGSAFDATLTTVGVFAFAVVVTLLGIYLARVPAYNSEDFMALQKSSFAPFLKDLAFKWHAGQVMLDLVLITICYYLAYRLRFDEAELIQFLPYFTSSLPVVIACQLAGLYASGLYQRSWETFGLRDLAAAGRGIGIGFLAAVLPASYLYREIGFSYGVYIIDALLLTFALVATRVSFRLMNLVASTRNKRSRRVLVYGAGSFGQLLVREMRANPDWQMNPVAFIDDDPMKSHKWITGVPVRGALEHLEVTLQRYAIDEVVLSSPKINGSVEHGIREICARVDRPVKRLTMQIQ